MISQYSEDFKTQRDWNRDFELHLAQQPSELVKSLNSDHTLKSLYETAIRRIKQIDALIASQAMKKQSK